jgi:hypothetical protein
MKSGVMIMANSEQYNQLWMDRIQDHIKGLKFGTVQITIHDGKIVQIDRTERSRFDSIDGNGHQAKSKTSSKPC